jgi:sugar phosphate isomerase/epimerase
MHAPIMDAMAGGKWVGSYSTASGNEARRKQAIEEIKATLDAARTVPYRYLVVHLGMPLAEKIPERDNQPAAARRSVEEIALLAADVGVTLALEVMPNALSTPDALCRLIEDDLEGADVGVCLDYGHANLGGDVAEAIETISGHLFTTHLHDNAGRRDDHLVPYAGKIDWDAAMMATQKVGYDGVLMFEVTAPGDPVAALKQMASARERLTKLFVTF